MRGNYRNPVLRVLSKFSANSGRCVGSRTGRLIGELIQGLLYGAV